MDRWKGWDGMGYTRIGPKRKSAAIPENRHVFMKEEKKKPNQQIETHTAVVIC